MFFRFFRPTKESYGRMLETNPGTESHYFVTYSNDYLTMGFCGVCVLLVMRRFPTGLKGRPYQRAAGCQYLPFSES